MQRMVDKGVRNAQWLYMRLDIPYIMPHLLKQREKCKQGQLLHISMSSLSCFLFLFKLLSQAQQHLDDMQNAQSVWAY